jgi:hypothetical protein
MVVCPCYRIRHPTLVTPMKHEQRSNEVTLYPPPAGTIASTEPGPKRVLSPTASKETNAADINGGTCLRYNHMPPFNHGQA